MSSRHLDKLTWKLEESGGLKTTQTCTRSFGRLVPKGQTTFPEVCFLQELGFEPSPEGQEWSDKRASEERRVGDGVSL